MPVGTATAGLLVLLGLGACATPDLIPAGPPAWREGYAAGCDSGASVAASRSRRYVRDAARVEADAAYAGAGSERARGGTGRRARRSRAGLRISR